MHTIRAMFANIPKRNIKPTTFDNGNKFFYHRLLPLWFKVRVYFADLNCSGQRGANQNTKGLLRQYFPKGMDAGSISWRLHKVAMPLNQSPRKRHDYQTPTSLFQ